jgi:hypothetical protein
MRKTYAIALGALLIAGSAVQMTSASARPVHREPAAASDQFLNANNSVAGRAGTFCSQEAGNPHDEQTDYMGWSAWRQSGAWDSRNDCQ